MPPTPVPPTATVRALRRERLGDTEVLEAVLAESDGRVVNIRLQGQEVRGVLAEGDRVVLDPAWNGPGPFQIDRLENVSTGAAVETWRPPLSQRTSAVVGRYVVPGALAPVTGALGLYLLQKADNYDLVGWPILVAATVALLAVGAGGVMATRQTRRPSVRLRAVATGAAGSVSLAAGVLFLCVASAYLTALLVLGS